MNKTILLVDDEPNFLEIFGIKMESLGFSVIKANGAVEGISQAKALHPDLVVLDVDMPNMNGAEVLAKLKEDPTTKDIKIIFLTNLGGPEEMSKNVNENIAKEIGAAGYLKKTMDIDRIAEGIKDYLENN